MSKYNSTLKMAIMDAISSPANPKISGEILQQQLLAMIEALDTGSIFMGPATTSTNPSTEANSVYLAATAGTYNNFIDNNGDAITLAAGEICLLHNRFSGNTMYWQKIVLPSSSDANEIKVLFVGNSNMVDAVAYLPYILKSVNPALKVTIGTAYIGGSCIAQHLAYFTNADASHKVSITIPTTSFSGGYAAGIFDFWVEPDDPNNQPFKRQKQGEEVVSYRGYGFKKCIDDRPWSETTYRSAAQVLANEDWDIIVLQDAPNIVAWTNTAQYLFPLQQAIGGAVGHAVQFGWLTTHTAANTAELMVEQWKGLTDTALRVMQQTGNSILFNAGSAIQGMRTIPDLMALGDGNHHGMCVDDIHLQEGIGCYGAACLIACGLLNAMGLDYNGVIGDATLPDTAEKFAQWLSDKNIPGQHVGTGAIGLDAQYCLLAQVAAVNATKYPYKIISPAFTNSAQNRIKGEVSEYVPAPVTAGSAGQILAVNGSGRTVWIKPFIYDVSAHNPNGGPNSDGTFTLDYILDSSNVDTLIPSSVRSGGMSIRFVQSSDNKYVQYWLMVDSFSTAVSDWQGVDETLLRDLSALKKEDLSSGMTLYEDNAFTADGTNVVAHQYYKIYKFSVKGLPNAVIDFALTNAIGTNMPIIFACKSDGTVIKELFRIQTNGNYVYNYIGETISDEIAYLLINKHNNSTYTPIRYDVTDRNNSVVTSEYHTYKETVIQVSPSVTGEGSLLNILKNLMDKNGYNPSKWNRYKIILDAGDYDLDSSALTFTDNKGIFLAPYTTIIGKGQGITNLIFRYTGDNDTVMSRFSPLNMPYSGIIKGLTIIAKNVKYAIHSDGPMTGGISANNADILLENVTLLHEGFDEGLSPSQKFPCAWGGGSFNNGHLHFKNCVFESRQCSAWANHDRLALTSPTVFEFENCDFISGSGVRNGDPMSVYSPSVFLNSWGSNVKMKAYFRNCRYNKFITLFAEQTYSSSCKVDYDVMFDNEPLVIVDTANNTDKDKHYSTGSCVELKFTSATNKGTPVMYPTSFLNLENGEVFDGSTKKFVGVLLHDVGADGFGVVQRSGYLYQPVILGTTFAAGKLIGWNGTAWVEDNSNPILVALTEKIAKLI